MESFSASVENELKGFHEEDGWESNDSFAKATESGCMLKGGNQVIEAGGEAEDRGELNGGLTPLPLLRPEGPLVFDAPRESDGAPFARRDS
eukprot:6188017-Pleurochrysis_carterae.AAC.1